MKRTSSCLAILLLAVVLADGRTVEMTLHPAKAPEPAQKYLFLPSPARAPLRKTGQRSRLWLYQDA